MSWLVSSWIYVWDSLCFLDMRDYFLSHIKEGFHYNSSNMHFFSNLFLFYSSSGTPIIQALLHLIHGSNSSILSSSWLIDSYSLVLLLTPSSVVFISPIILFITICSFFKPSRSLLNISYIFSIHASILFLRCWIIFTFWIIFTSSLFLILFLADCLSLLI